MCMFASLSTYIVSDLKMDTKMQPVDTTDQLSWNSGRTGRQSVPEIASEVACCAIPLALLDNFFYSYVEQSFLLQVCVSVSFKVFSNRGN